MPKVVLKENEVLDDALKRFKTSGISATEPLLKLAKENFM